MINKIKRAIVIVLDGVGVGEAPDASAYGDEGSNSVGNTAQKIGGLTIPTMQSLGFGNIIPIKGVAEVADVQGAWGKLQPKSAGKDSVTGHWELMGIYLERPFPTYPNGFPDDAVKAVEKATGVEFIGNVVASGTVIVQEMGAEHVRTGKPILYTSADSVFQIAAHEEVIPLERLYEICEIARVVLVGEHGVGRVIARPFIGNESEGFTRTKNRHDYSITTPNASLIDNLADNDKTVTAVGKIYDLFGGQNIAEYYPAKTNMDSLEQLEKALAEIDEGLIFVNLVEFDQNFGHRNNYEGYANAIREFDTYFPKIMSQLNEDDIVFISADHGVDPTTDSTDHSREYVPLLVFGGGIDKPVNLGTRSSLADVGATIAEIFDVETPQIGSSFLGLL
ncbi:MAG: phosphopentomutase [Phototrophicaceae bacterium]